jgi:hypothetical protein
MAIFDEYERRSKAIRSDQKRSKAIKSDQKRSAQKRSEAFRSAQKRSEALRSAQKRSEAIKSDQKRSKAIKSDQKRSQAIKPAQNLTNANQLHFAELIRHVQQISRQAYRASITHIYSPDGLYKHSQEQHLIYIQIKATNRSETVWINVSSRWTVNLCDPGPTLAEQCRVAFHPTPSLSTFFIPYLTSPSSGRENFPGFSSHAWRCDSCLCCDFPSPSLQSQSSPSLPLASWPAAQQAVQLDSAGMVAIADRASLGRTWRSLCKDVSSGCIRQQALAAPDVGRPYHIIDAIVTETLQSLGKLEDLGTEF